MPVQSLIKVRRGTAAAWTSANPTLADGEIGYETDTGKMKVGDGFTQWTLLSYQSGVISVRKNSTGTVFSRHRLNLIEGSNIILTVADDSANDEIDTTIASVVQVRKNSTGSTYSRGRINLIEGSNVSVTIADDSGNNEVDTTIAATSAVRKNSTGSTYNRARINFIEGSNVTITVADDSTDQEIDVTIASTGGGGGGSVATDTIWDAKGDLAVGTGADTAAKLTVGSNYRVVMADSSQTTGLAYSDIDGGSA